MTRYHAPTPTNAIEVIVHLFRRILRPASVAVRARSRSLSQPWSRGAIAALGLVVGVLACCAVLVEGRSPTSPDDALYRSLATSLAAGRGYVDSSERPFTVRGPGYAGYLAPAVDATGPASPAPWVAQAVAFGALVAAGVILIGQSIGPVGAIVAVGLVLSAPDILGLGTSLRVDAPRWP